MVVLNGSQRTLHLFFFISSECWLYTFSFTIRNLLNILYMLSSTLGDAVDDFFQFYVWALLSSTMTSSTGNIFRATGPLCGEFTGHRWIFSQRSVTRSFDVLVDLRLIKRLSKKCGPRWFEMAWRLLWHNCNATNIIIGTLLYQSFLFDLCATYKYTTYRKNSSISRTKFQSLNVSCILLQLSSLNRMKPGVELRMKM